MASDNRNAMIPSKITSFKGRRREGIMCLAGGENGWGEEGGCHHPGY